MEAVPYRKARRIRSSLEWSDGIDTAYRPDAVLSILDRLVARPPLPPGCLQGPKNPPPKNTEVMAANGPDSFTGYLVSVMSGSTEATFYVLAL